MNNLTVHTRDTAPEKSKALLDNSIKAFGSVPSLHGVLAESPEALEAYQLLHKLFVATSFDAEELTVVWQTINVENNCHYCVPAHAAIAKMMKVDDALTAAHVTVVLCLRLNYRHCTTQPCRSCVIAA